MPEWLSGKHVHIMFTPRPGRTKDHHKSDNALALCHPPSASLCSLLVSARKIIIPTRAFGYKIIALYIK